MRADADITDPITQVRGIIADTDEAHQLLPDQHINAFLHVEDGNVKLAAAQALDTIASSESLISKKIRSQDLSTDGPAVAKDLREHAARLRTQVAAEAEDGFGLEIVDFNPHGYL